MIKENFICSDCHMHTMFSGDSEALPEEMVQSAIEKNLEAICFTDHMDKDYFCDGVEYIFDTQAYCQHIAKLREKYGDRIHIRMGIELGLQPYLTEYLKSECNKEPYDYVIGSVHVVGGKDPYYPDFFEGITDEEGYRKTFEETLLNVQKFHDFDALGHLDYVVRYGKMRDQSYDYYLFREIIDEILIQLIRYDKALELNTAGLKYGLPFAHPKQEILKRYRELGGTMVTVGADAHKPEHVAYRFESVGEILRECGFREYVEFIDRKPIFRPLM